MMTNNKARVPKIRFKGFTDTWIERKFSEIVKRISQQSKASNLSKVEFEDIISQQMFPQGGEKVPRARFGGFSEDCEDEKLGKILIKNSEKNIGKIISNIETVSNKYEFVKQSEYFEDRQITLKDTSNYYVIRKGAFAYNPSRINVGSIAIKENDDVSHVKLQII